MKNYKVVASKQKIAVFTMDYNTYCMQFPCPSKFVEWILGQHDELKNCPWDDSYNRCNITVTFYSLGNLVVIEED